MDSEQSIFERIMSGQIPSELLYEDDHAIVIRDINPQAPVHILLIPRVKIPRLAGKMAKQLGCDEAFRLIINNGADAGQTVFHLHLHILANKSFEEGQLATPFG